MFLTDVRVTFPFESGVMLPCRGVPRRSRNGVLPLALALAVTVAWHRKQEQRRGLSQTR